MPKSVQATCDFFFGVALCNLAFAAEAQRLSARAFLLSTGVMMITLAFYQIRHRGRRS